MTSLEDAFIRIKSEGFVKSNSEKEMGDTLPDSYFHSKSLKTSVQPVI